MESLTEYEIERRGIVNELTWQEYKLRRLQAIRHRFVKMAAWSHETAARMDEVNAEIKEAEDYIQELNEELQMISNHSSTVATGGE